MNDRDFLFWLQGVLEVKVKFNGSKELEEILKDVKEHNEGGKTGVSGSVANAVGRNCPFFGEPCTECSHKATDR